MRPRKRGTTIAFCNLLLLSLYYATASASAPGARYTHYVYTYVEEERFFFFEWSSVVRGGGGGEGEHSKDIFFSSLAPSLPLPLFFCVVFVRISFSQEFFLSEIFAWERISPSSAFFYSFFAVVISSSFPATVLKKAELYWMDYTSFQNYGGENAALELKSSNIYLLFVAMTVQPYIKTIQFHNFKSF